MDQYLYPFVILQNLFFAVMLLRSKRQENKYLIFIFLLKALVSIIDFTQAQRYEWMETSPIYWAWIIESSPYVANLLLMYYCSTLLNRPILKWQKLAWAIPVFVAIATPLYQLHNHSAKSLEAYLNSNFNIANHYATVSSFIIYIIWQLRIIRKALRKDELTQYQRICLHWTIWLLWFAFLRTGVVTFCNTTYYLIYLGVIPDRDYAILLYVNPILTVLSTLSVTIFGYIAITNPAIFNDAGGEEPGIGQKIAEMVLPSEQKTVSKKYTLPADVEKKYLQSITEVLIYNKAYLDNDLSQKKLAEITQIPHYQVSIIINKHFNKSFNELINYYRIEYAKQFLQANSAEKHTMYAVALECGFNTLSVFYSAFKKQVGCTPVQFISENPSLT